MVADERGDGGQEGFLPPEPGGLEPDLGPGAPPQQPPPAPGAWQPPQHSQAPPSQYPPPPPQYPQPPPYHQPGWQQPPAPPWTYQPQPATPDNGSAVAGFVLSVAAAALLVFTAGISSVISVICAGLGIFYSRKGRNRVDRGETPKHRGLAQAGFITGIVTLVLALLATAFWALMVILYATDDEFRRDFENDLENSDSDGIQSTIRLAGMLGRIAWSLAA